MRVLCSSRKPMRKTLAVPGFSRALLSFSHARKRRALGSRLHYVHTAISKNVVRENDECQLSNGDCTTEKKCGY